MQSTRQGRGDAAMMSEATARIGFVLLYNDATRPGWAMYDDDGSFLLKHLEQMEEVSVRYDSADLCTPLDRERQGHQPYLGRVCAIDPMSCSGSFDRALF